MFTEAEELHVQIYEGKSLNNKNFILKCMECTMENLIAGHKMAA